MELSNTKKLNAYKAILPKVQNDNLMPICILLGEHLEKKVEKQKEVWQAIINGKYFPEIKAELVKQNREHFFLRETRVPFIKKQIEILTNKNN